MGQKHQDSLKYNHTKFIHTRTKRECIDPNERVSVICEACEVNEFGANSYPNHRKNPHYKPFVQVDEVLRVEWEWARDRGKDNKK